MFGLGMNQSTVKDMTPKEWKRLRQPIADAWRPYIDQEPLFGYEGPTVSPFTAGEQGSLENLRGLSAAPAPAFDPYLAGLASGQQQANPFLTGAIEEALRPIRRTAERQRAMNRSEISALGQDIGQSSPFFQLQSDADENQLDREAGVASMMSMQAYEPQMQRQFRAAQIRQDAQERQQRVRFDREIKRFEAEAKPRLIAEMGIERGMREYDRRQQMLLNVLAQASGSSAPNLATESFGFSVEGSMA